MKRLLGRFLKRCADAVIEYARNDPYFHLQGYMERYWVLRPHRWLPISIRVHHILRSDLDRHLHDHPWRYLTIILRGGYWEQRPLFGEPLPTIFGSSLKPYSGCAEPVVARRHQPGAILLRKPTDRHRLILNKGETCWTFFVMGPRQQKWGFYTESGKVAWDEYLNECEVAEQHAGHERFGLTERSRIPAIATEPAPRYPKLDKNPSTASGDLRSIVACVFLGFWLCLMLLFLYRHL